MGTQAPQFLPEARLDAELDGLPLGQRKRFDTADVFDDVEQMERPAELFDEGHAVRHGHSGLVAEIGGHENFFELDSHGFTAC